MINAKYDNFSCHKVQCLNFLLNVHSRTNSRDILARGNNFLYSPVCKLFYDTPFDLFHFKLNQLQNVTELSYEGDRSCNIRPKIKFHAF